MNIKPGRVVDLKKLGRKEEKKIKKTAIATVGFLLLFSWFFWRRKKAKNLKTDFLKNYKKWQKREEFIEQEFLREFDDNKPVKRVSGLFGAIFLAGRFTFILGKSLRKMFFPAKSAKKPKPILAIKNGLVNSTLFKNIFSGQNKDDRFYRRIWGKKSARRAAHPLKKAAAFLVFSAIVLLPFKVAGYLRVLNIGQARARVISVSEQALANLRLAAGAASELDMSGAEENFESAKNNFGAAKKELDDINDLLLNLGKYAPSEEIRLASYGKEIISAAEAAASAGSNLSQAGDVFLSSIKNGKTLSEAIDAFIDYEKKAKEDIDLMNSYLEKINQRALPAGYQEDFALLKEKSEDLPLVLSGTIELLGKLNIFLGAESDKRYLLVFENNREMRASGGFIGSYALLDLSRGRLKNIEVPQGGSYDTEGGLLKKIISPEPLWLVNPLWHFWDANWWPDWKQSAQKLTWFYEKSGGPTVDGVIAFTPTVLERMLEIIGPIDLTEKYGAVIDSNNLWENLRDVIEKEKADESLVPYELAEKKPKKVIGDLFSAIVSELPARLDKDKAFALFAGLAESLEEKQALLYFDNDKLQTAAEKNNFAGRIKETDKDYLMVVNTNIAGGKSDGKMKEEITHSAEVLPDGSIVNTLMIKRIHQGALDEPFYGMRNVDWMRIYVPLGSKLLEASGFRGPDPIYFELPEEDWQNDPDVVYEEGSNAIIDRDNLNTKVYQESGKTVFANWSMVDPGQRAVIILKYKLPFRLEKKTGFSDQKNFLDWVLSKTGRKKEEKDIFIYSLLAQKQAGSLYTSLSSNLVLAPEFDIAWKYPDGLNQDPERLFFGDLQADIYSAVILEKEKKSF